MHRAKFLFLTAILTAPDAAISQENTDFSIRTTLYPFRQLYFNHPLAEYLYQTVCSDTSPECPFETKEDFYVRLYAVAYIEYSFKSLDFAPCPFAAERCEPFDQWVSFEKRVAFDIDDVVSGIRQTVASYGYSGCSFLNVFSSPAAVSDDEITIQGRYQGKRRFCDNILGTHDIGESTGNFVIRLGLNIEDIETPLPLTKDATLIGDISLDINFSTYNQDNDFLLIFDLDTFLGRFLAYILTLPATSITGLFGGEGPSEAIRQVLRFSDSLDAANLSESDPSPLSDLLAVTSQFPDQGVQFFPYVLSRDLSRFDNVDGRAIVVTGYRKILPDIQSIIDTIIQTNTNSIDFFNSLDEIEREYIIQSGDFLEGIVADNYKDLTLTYYVANRNNISNPNNINSGQIIVLPPVWEASLEIARRQLIGPGKSYYSFMMDQKLSPNEAMNIIDEQGLSNYILPYQVEAPIHQMPELNN